MDIAALMEGEALFPGKEDRALLGAFYRWILARFPDARAIPQKSQISFACKGPFCVVTPPGRWGKKSGIGLSLFLDERLESPRFLHIANPYPNRFSHHMVLSAPDQLDEELATMLAKARQFKMRTGRGIRP